MKCPVSMLPNGGDSMGSMLFVIGVIAAISYVIKMQTNTH